MKLRRMSKVSGRTETADSVARSKKNHSERGRGMELLLQAQRLYMCMAKFRQNRERCKRYTYGDQWEDEICVDGRRMSEKKYIEEQGNIPLKQNLIRRLVRNVIGVHRSQSTEPTCIARDQSEQREGETMTTILQYNMQLNMMQELYARSLEEFLISGMAVHRKWYGKSGDKEDCWTEAIQPNNFFIDINMRDSRMWDCQIVGEIHDVSFEELASQFATSPEEYRRLSEIYYIARDRQGLMQTMSEFGQPNNWEKSFLFPTDESRCRVIEIWRKETKERYWCHDPNSGTVYKIEKKDYQRRVVQENINRLMEGARMGIPEQEVPLIRARYMIDSFWYCYYLSPTGDILWEGETPYEHGEHPYVFKAYPFIDGEIHSFVEDVIDQQRLVNRLIILHDWVVRASAKGVLLIPEDSIPDDMTPRDFAEEWSRVDGVIIYKPSASREVPKQVSANSTTIGTSELLNLQLKMLEEISGVNGALQGKPGYSGMSAALYSQQTQNATTSLLDILDCFGDFMKAAAYKDVKNIQQFYTPERVRKIVGDAGVQFSPDPERVLNIEFDLSVVPSQATPVYRAAANDMLMQMWQAGAITAEEMLETGSFPFGEHLLQVMQSRKEQEAQAQMQMQMQAQQQGAAQGQTQRPASGATR